MVAHAIVGEVSDPIGIAVADALAAVLGMTDAVFPATGTSAQVATDDVVDADRLVTTLFAQEGASLVRLARLFVDDRNAAEDLVQEAFIRLARSTHRIADPAKAPAYLRSIVLNLARDSNRRGLVSMRHQLPFDDRVASIEDQITVREDQQQVIDALRDLPHRQRQCLVLRYYDELGIDDIADTIGCSRNSVKTHLQRGLAALERKLAAAAADAAEDEDAARIAVSRGAPS
ncbi:MAG: SigE family RNA polymerase sigma factor [Acidimicrobiia bacterium]